MPDQRQRFWAAMVICLVGVCSTSVRSAVPGVRPAVAEDRLAAADYDWQTFGENVALGQSSAAAALDSWMDSRGHRKNILNPDFTELGAGYALDRAGRPYYVQVFGSPSS